MPEYDAFGNPIVPAGSAVSPAPPPEVRPGPERGGGPGGPGGGGGRRGPLGWLAAIVIVAAVVAGVGAGVVELVSDVSSSLSPSSPSFSEPDTTTETTESGEPARKAKRKARAKRPARPKAPPGPPTALSSRSLLLRHNFAPAMLEIRRRAGGGKPVYVRVEPTRIDVQVKLPKGGLRMIQRPWDHRATVIADAPNGNAPATMLWGAVDPAAPSRLAIAVRNGSTRPSKQLSYAVVLAALRQWSAFRPDGTFYTSGLSGRDAQRRSG